MDRNKDKLLKVVDLTLFVNISLKHVKKKNMDGIGVVPMVEIDVSISTVCLLAIG